MPGVSWAEAMPDDAVVAFRPDSRSAVIALSHDPKLDDLALLEALRSEAFFVGAIGSRRNNEARRERLAEHFDMTADELARLPWLALRTYYRNEVTLSHAVTGETRRIAIQPRVSTDSLYALRSAALLGLGACVASAWLLADDLVDSGATLVEVLPALRARHPQLEEMRSAVIWRKGASVAEPDFYVESLPTNPWIHQPFEEYDHMRPGDLKKRWGM